MKKYGLLYLLLSCFISCKEKKEKDLILEHNGNRIAYERCGQADTTLLFIHGWCINKEYWHNQVAYFCPRYQVVTIDLPGFGSSGKNLDSSWRFADYTEDVIFVIKTLRLKNVVLIGHSMSGDLVLDLARRYPENVAGLVGIDNLHQPAGIFPDSALRQVHDFFGLMVNRFDSIVRQNMESILFQPGTDSLVRNRVMRDILGTRHELAVKVLESNTVFSQQEQAAMKELRFPLCLVNSDVYPVSRDSLDKYCAKGFRLELVHGSGHYPMLEKPAEFNRALQQILDSLQVK